MSLTKKQVWALADLSQPQSDTFFWNEEEIATITGVNSGILRALKNKGFITGTVLANGIVLNLALVNQETQA